MVKVMNGDMFHDVSVEALVNPVNTVGVMGKGLALEFKKRFQAASEFYMQSVQNEDVGIGQMIVFDNGEWNETNRYVIHFPTKVHWRNPSKIEYIEHGMIDLIRVVRDYDIASIAIPALGCGLGGLPWANVLPIIRKPFATMPDVAVYLFEP